MCYGLSIHSLEKALASQLEVSLESDSKSSENQRTRKRHCARQLEQDKSMEASQLVCCKRKPRLFARLATVKRMVESALQI